MYDEHRAQRDGTRQLALASEQPHLLVILQEGATARTYGPCLGARKIETTYARQQRLSDRGRLPTQNILRVDRASLAMQSRRSA